MSEEARIRERAARPPRRKPALTAVYSARMAATFMRDPREGVDQLRNRLAVMRERSGEQSDALSADHDWQQSLHSQLATMWPCAESGHFESLWADVASSVETSSSALGFGYDGDPTLACAVWCAVRHLGATRVVETGVGRGVTSRFILEALTRGDEGGHLWSIDLPPIEEPWHSEVGICVPAGLRNGWTYLRGSSRRLLGGLLDDLQEIDLFVHDSLHTKENIRFELETVWPAIRPGGLVIVDDIVDSSFFESVSAGLPHAVPLLARHAQKDAAIGIISKRPDVT